MSSTFRLTSLLVCAGLAAACGRGQLDTVGFGADDEDGAVSSSFDALPTDGTVVGRDSGFPPSDGAVPGPDIGPVFDGGGPLRDGGPGRDSGLNPRDTGPRDGGAPFECQAPADCFASLGVPRCPNGPGRWQCIDGLCNPDCPAAGCATDCDCPFGESCTGQGCAPINRMNLCCANPMCMEGQVCVEPDGDVGRCGGDPDGGVPGRDAGRDGGRDSGIPTRDAGPRDSGTPGLDGGPATDAGTMCSTDCDCDPRLACLGGQCRPAGRQNQCCTAPSCMAGQMCIQPDGTPGMCGSTTPVGAACEQTGSECGPSGFCIDEGSGFPDGYCTQSCGRMSMCPAGATCRGGGGNAFCLDECAQPADCRTGYNCIQLGVGTGSRVCWPVPPTSTNPMGAAVGSACSADQDCAAGTSCVQEQGFPGGYCTVLYCDPQTSPCPGGSSCYAFPGLFSMCLADCPEGGMRSSCRPQYYCLGPSGQSGVCIGN